MSPQVQQSLQGFWERQRQRAIARAERQAVYYEQRKQLVRLGIAGTLRPHRPMNRAAVQSPVSRQAFRGGSQGGQV